jgi:hypothetical protein
VREITGSQFWQDVGQCIPKGQKNLAHKCGSDVSTQDIYLTERRSGTDFFEGDRNPLLEMKLQALRHFDEFQVKQMGNFYVLGKRLLDRLYGQFGARIPRSRSLLRLIRHSRTSQ